MSWPVSAVLIAVVLAIGAVLREAAKKAPSDTGCCVVLIVAAAAVAAVVAVLR